MAGDIHSPSILRTKDFYTECTSKLESFTVATKSLISHLSYFEFLGQHWTISSSYDIYKKMHNKINFYLGLL